MDAQQINTTWAVRWYMYCLSMPKGRTDGVAVHLVFFWPTNRETNKYDNQMEINTYHSFVAHICKQERKWRSSPWMFGPYCSGCQTIFASDSLSSVHNKQEISTDKDYKQNLVRIALSH